MSREVSTGVDVHSVLEPLGVVAGITPFNFPVMVPLWMMANALACGNAFILKPSEKDPSPSLLLAELAREAGLPDGVLNVVHGDAVAVDALLTHPGVAAVSFVGSTPIARSIYEKGAQAGKRVQALGGAKNHMIVLPDADVEAAADAAISAGFGSAGERCMAISVVVAVGAVADPLVEAIAARVPSLVIGPGSDPESQMGPLVTAEHRAPSLLRGGRQRRGCHGGGRRARGVARGLLLGLHAARRGATRHAGLRRRDLRAGPERRAGLDLRRGLGPGQRESLGNGTALFTRDGGAARRFEREVSAGMVGINVAIPVPVGFHSFGGWKASIFGDSAMYGPEGIRFYTRPKVVTTRWPDPASSVIDLGFPQTR